MPPKRKAKAKAGPNIKKLAADVQEAIRLMRVKMDLQDPPEASEAADEPTASTETAEEASAVKKRPSAKARNRPKAAAKAKPKPSCGKRATLEEEQGQDKEEDEGDKEDEEDEHEDTTTEESGFIPENLDSPLRDFPVHKVNVEADMKTLLPDDRLSNPETYLQTLVDMMLDRLSRRELDALAAVFRTFGPSIPFASICAGTDCPRLVMETLASAVAARVANSGATFKHVFSVEADESKREFLKDLFAMSRDDRLYGDVKDMVNTDEAVDYTKTLKTLENDEPQPQKSSIPKNEVKVTVAGFPCKDASIRNYNQQKNRGSISGRKGVTGSTFGAILDLVEQKSLDSSLFCLFENVLGLAIPPKSTVEGNGAKKKVPMSIHESNLAISLQMMSDQIDHFAFALQMDPRSFACPQSRGRFYMPAISRKFLKQHDISEQEMYVWTTSLLDRLAGGYGLAPLDGILLSPEHPVLKEHMEAMKEKPAPWTLPSESDDKMKWPAQHAKEASAGSQRWWTTNDLKKVEVDLPGVKEHSKRAFDMLVVKGVSFPEKRRRLVEVSQVAARVKVHAAFTEKGMLPCVTPKLALYMTDIARNLLGFECLRLQGIWYGKDGDLKLAKYLNSFLRDLAGNAFHSGSFAAALIATMTAIGIGIKKKQGCKVHAPRDSALFKGAALLDSDDSDHDADTLWPDSIPK